MCKSNNQKLSFLEAFSTLLWPALVSSLASPTCHDIESVSQEGQTVLFSTARYQHEITGDSLPAAVSSYQSAMMIDPTRGTCAEVL